ncbi:MAG: alkaline phosphatase D family protein [Candidatus Methylumidiphilus sp.]
MKILLGPILGYEQNELYTVCFLSDPGSAAPTLTIAGQQVPFTQITQTPNGVFWRSEATVAAAKNGKPCEYKIENGGTPLQDTFGRSAWSFYVPGKAEEPKIAYASCNGFSSTKLARDTANPYALWQTMNAEHSQKPYSLMLMGGDQIYADGLWESSLAPTINQWSHWPREKQQKYPVGPKIQKELDKFYEQAYIKGWGYSSDMALMLASIPSVMMWDDHDIFDGWGSYAPMAKGGLQDCPIYLEIFKYAKKYFELFQVRSLKNNTLLNSAGVHYAFGLQFRAYFILGIDNRVERSQVQLMSEGQWAAVKDWLSKLPQKVENLLVMAGLPLVYRDFAEIDALLQATPWQVELQDDAHDHWTAKAHQGERMRLIQILLDINKQKKCKTVILSGDVHVGALGVIKDEVNQLQITQVVSSAIVHPAPTFFEWLGIAATTSDGKQRLGNGDITAEVIPPIGSDKYIRMRNYSSLEIGTDKKIWVNWICEGNVKPHFPISK